MRRSIRRIVAALAGAATIATPATAWADTKPGQKFCPTYTQVESNATGGQYVGGILIYETMGSVTRNDGQTNTSVSTTSGATAGVPNVASGSATTTVTVTTEGESSSITAEEPIGYYRMNDGSVYQINCLTGDGDQIN
jgi:hypothetical protein